MGSNNSPSYETSEIEYSLSDESYGDISALDIFLSYTYSTQNDVVTEKESQDTILDTLRHSNLESTHLDLSASVKPSIHHTCEDGQNEICGSTGILPDDMDYFQYDESGNHLSSLNLNLPHPIQMFYEPPSTESEIELPNDTIDQIQRVIELSITENQECPMESAGPSTKRICRSQPVPEYFSLPFSDNKMSSTLDKSDNSLTNLFSREGNSGDDFYEALGNINEFPQQSECYSNQQNEAESEQNCLTLRELLTKSSAAPPPQLQKVYISEELRRKLTNKSLLDSHYEDNDIKYPHKCQKCTRAFQYKSKLLRHSSVHSVEKPFKCDYCKSTFKRGDSLYKHIKIYHK